MDLLARVLGFVLKLRGRPLPPGEHLSVDPAYSAFGWPDEPVVFKFTVYSADDEPLGSYVATADSDTRCSIDGNPASLDQVLALIGEQHDRVRVTAVEPGKLAVLELS